MSAHAANARSAQARAAVLIRHGRSADDPEVVSQRRTMHEARLADYIETTLAKAPPLTDEQRTRLAALLRPVTVR